MPRKMVAVGFKSNLTLWQKVEKGRMKPENALKKLESLPGGSSSQTYRRIKRRLAAA